MINYIVVKAQIIKYKKYTIQKLKTCIIIAIFKSFTILAYVNIDI